MQTDTEYFRNRARQERNAANRTGDVRVRLRHLEFAEAYALRLREIVAQERRSAFHLIDVARDLLPESSNGFAHRSEQLPQPMCIAD